MNSITIRWASQLPPCAPPSSARHGAIPPPAPRAQPPSYTVSQSTQELGLRMALGAAPSNLLRLVLSRGLLLTTTGVLLGVALALALTRLLGDLLYQVNPLDPLAFAAALAVMTLASFAACSLPAWRATRTDPIRALRAQ